MFSGQKHNKQNETLSFFAVIRAGFKTSIAQLKTLLEHRGKYIRFWQWLTF